MRINECLWKLTGDKLREFAGVLREGKEKLPTRKADFVEFIKKRLLGDPKRWLGKEPEAERTAWAEIAHHGEMRPDAFEAKFGLPFPKIAGGWQEKAQTVFAYTVFRSDPDGAHDLPDELKQAVAPLLAPPQPLELPGCATAEELSEWPAPVEGWSPQGMPRERKAEVRETATVAPAEATALLALAAKGKLKIAKSRQATAATERAVTPLLVGGDFPLDDPNPRPSPYYLEPKPPGAVRAAAWPGFLVAAKWAKASADGKLSLTKAGTSLLSGFDAVAYREGIERLINDDKFDELARIPEIRGQSGRGKRYLTNPALRRGTIFDGLAEMPPGRWFSFDEVFRFLWANGFAFETSDEPGSLYLVEAHYGQLYVNGAGNKLSRLYLSAVLFETFGTLGLVDVAFCPPHGERDEFSRHLGVGELAYLSRYDGLFGIRINPLGAFCLGIAESLEVPAPAATGQFRVLPTLEIALTGGRCEPFDALRIERACVSVSDHLWRLDEATILRSMENGQVLDEIEEGIRSLAGESLPSTVVSFFHDIRDRATAVVRREEAELIEFRDARTATLLASRPELRKICERAGEKSLVVPKKNLRALATRLKQHGYLLPVT